MCGMIIEPLQGYGGIFPLDKGYMKEAFAMVREAGGICISDEVQTGCVSFILLIVFIDRSGVGVMVEIVEIVVVAALVTTHTFRIGFI